MRFDRAYIPYGAYWSTPFCKWQGSLANFNAVELAASVTREALAARDLPPTEFESLVLGMTVPQRGSFYGPPWLAGLIGADGISGPLVNQACATGARSLAMAAGEVETGGSRAVLAITADRCSNGPHLVFPNPAGPGGTVEAENWVWDNFGRDPWAANSMLETAEAVARTQGISRAEQDEVALVRFEQYQRALADDHAFQKRYMVWPLTVTDRKGRPLATVRGDEGVFPTTADGLAGLRPVLPDGTVTFGSQTHPADGHCGMVVCDRERARALARDPGFEVQLLSFGQCRVERGLMGMAPVPAARAALASAGLDIEAIDVVKTHNPFAVNDVYLARELGLDIAEFNDYGSSLVYGHPQGPTGMRLVMETVEQLALRGGGHGLFTGCAAGDSAAALCLRVTAR